MSKSGNAWKKHKMAVSIFRELSKEERQAYIEASRARSEEKNRLRRAASAEKVEKLKQGREFIRKNGVAVFDGSIGGYLVTAGALLETVEDSPGFSAAVAYRVCYAIASSREAQASYRVGCGYVGWRLMDKGSHPYTFNVRLASSGALAPERLAGIIRLHIEMDALSKRVRVPAKMHMALLLGCHGENVMSCISIGARAWEGTSIKRLRKTIN